MLHKGTLTAPVSYNNSCPTVPFSCSAAQIGSSLGDHARDSTQVTQENVLCHCFAVAQEKEYSQSEAMASTSPLQVIKNLLW